MITLSVKEAQDSLDSLAQRALRGEQIFIRIEESGELLSFRRIEPELPPNYLAECYGVEEIARENYLVGFAPRNTAALVSPSVDFKD